MPFTPFQRKYYAWLSYAFASEVFVIVSLTLFLPICLEQFARDNGSCSRNGSDEAQRCVVKIGWVWIDSASFRCILYLYNPLLSKY